MALSDFPSASRERMYLRSTSGLQQAGGVCTGWTDETGKGDATMATTNVPAYIADSRGDASGPTADHSEDNGFDSNYTTGTTWTAFASVRFNSLTGFTNILGDNSATTFGLYVNVTTWTLQDGANTITFGTAAAIDTDYHICVRRDATEYIVYINGVSQSLSSPTPGATPTIATSSYGGTTAPMDGELDCWGIYSDAKNASDIADIYQGQQNEISPPATISGTASGTSTATATLSATASVAASASGTSTATAIPQGGGTIAGTASGTSTATATTSATASVTASASGTSTATATIDGGTGWDDDFAGNGALRSAYQTHNSGIVSPNRTNGRYRALFSAGSQTGWFNADRGRADYIEVSMPFDLVALNAGIGTAADSQVAPGPDDDFMFAFIQVLDSKLIADAGTADYMHLAAGERGGVHRIEGKATVSDSSSVTEDNTAAPPNGRADLRVTCTAAGVLTWYWRLPGDTTWIAYNDGTNAAGTVPGQFTLTTTGSVLVGMGGYGFLFTPEFVATIDALESNDVVAATTGTASGTSTAAAAVSGVAALTASTGGTSTAAAALSAEASLQATANGNSTAAAAIFDLGANPFKARRPGDVQVLKRSGTF